VDVAIRLQNLKEKLTRQIAFHNPPALYLASISRPVDLALELILTRFDATFFSIPRKFDGSIVYDAIEFVCIKGDCHWIDGLTLCLAFPLSVNSPEDSWFDTMWRITVGILPGWKAV